VLDAALKNGAKKVVLASSAAIYGASPPPLSESAGKDPMSPYGKSKLDMELLASRYSEEQGLGTLSLRYFNVYGPRQSSGSEYSGVISRFMDALLMGKRPVIYGDGGQTRDFIYVSDVVRSNIMAMESSACKGEGINIATGKPVSVNELLETIAELMEKDADADSLEEREGDIKHSYADVSKAKELLGFEAEYSLEKGLEKTISWRKGTF
jgi:nucleoside-diphosphate-sugar epimerase